jgi:DNA-binding transcriptional MerR regulator
LRRLAFIRHSRELGFDIEAIRTLLTLQDNPSQPCATADTIAQARLADVVQRIRSLTALKAELELMVEGCRHGKVGECRVIEVLADHSQCEHARH